MRPVPKEIAQESLDAFNEVHNSCRKNGGILFSVISAQTGLGVALHGSESEIAMRLVGACQKEPHIKRILAAALDFLKKEEAKIKAQ